MERKFNTKLTEIKNIGDELRFQREYYNFKNSPNKLTPKIYKGRNSKYLGEVLKEFLCNNFEYMNEQEQYYDENKGEYGANETMLYDIEHNRIRASKEKDCGKYNIDSYYLRIYSLFKIYGFLDDYEIIMLLDKYNINPSFKQSEIEIKTIKEKCFNDYSNNPKKSSFSLRFCMLNNRHIEQELKNKYKDLKHICFKEYDEKILNGTFTSICFRNLKAILLEKFNKLTDIEKKYTSLELGKETNFIDDFLKRNNEHNAKDKIYITLETLSRIINYLELNNTDLEFIVNKKMEIQRTNTDDIQRDIFDFRKKWGI